ncbi:hypothetical protein EVAR_47658_1 [Eumeta japonica]|uniref:Uncharacterized protein n=1 Tax=Eumeta variegata TaxID=151549 RepID=A0A4C1Y1H2_EUMVA|nr:hypothetical protein EVAR_47658_1 [Eumeta japonica]
MHVFVHAKQFAQCADCEKAASAARAGRRHAHATFNVALKLPTGEKHQRRVCSERVNEPRSVGAPGPQPAAQRRRINKRRRLISPRALARPPTAAQRTAEPVWPLLELYQLWIFNAHWIGEFGEKIGRTRCVTDGKSRAGRRLEHAARTARAELALIKYSLDSENENRTKVPGNFSHT